MSSEKMGLLDHLPASALPKKSISVRMAIYAMRLAYWSVVRLGRRRKLVPGSIIFFARTQNQMHAVEGMRAFLEGSKVLSEKDSEFPLGKAYVIGLLYIPFFLWRQRKTSIYEKRAIRYELDRYILAYGLYHVSLKLFDEAQPKALVISNDHTTECRAVMFAAKKMGVPTFYVQHASVTDKFPPLEVDYALLEGVDAAEKYEKAGTNRCQIYLVGVCRLDRYIARNDAESDIETIAVCSNKLDRLEDVQSICTVVASAFPKARLIVRPHPTDFKRFDKFSRLSDICAGELSDPTLIPPGAILCDSDVVIGSHSNILLEAVIAGCLSVQYVAPESAINDYYGFIENGICAKAENIRCLPDVIKEQWERRFERRLNAKRYCETIGTSFDGRSGELAAGIVAEHVGGSSVMGVPNNWIKRKSKRGFIVWGLK